MNKDELRNRILNLIELRKGMKGAEIVTTLMGVDLNLEIGEVFDVIFDMIHAGDICEIEYIVPRGNSKSFLVPRGTVVNIINKTKVK